MFFFLVCLPSKQVTCMAVSVDGSLLVTGSHDCDVRIWDIRSKQCIRTITHKGMFMLLNQLMITYRKSWMSYEIDYWTSFRSFDKCPSCPGPSSPGCSGRDGTSSTHSAVSASSSAGCRVPWWREQKTHTLCQTEETGGTEKCSLWCLFCENVHEMSPSEFKLLLLSFPLGMMIRIGEWHTLCFRTYLVSVIAICVLC